MGICLFKQGYYLKFHSVKRFAPAMNRNWQIKEMDQRFENILRYIKMPLTTCKRQKG